MISFEDLREGLELPECAKVVTREDVNAYADAGGDQNPLHQDDSFARGVGFEGIIAHGMFTMGHMAQCLVDWLGSVESVVRLKAGFRAPVSMGETILAGGRVISIDPEARTAEVELWVKVERDGEVDWPVKRGEADLRFPG